MTAANKESVNARREVSAGRHDSLKRSLRARGWSYRTAAEYLGVSYQHICLVLAGERISERLLFRLSIMPPRTK